LPEKTTGSIVHPVNKLSLLLPSALIQLRGHLRSILSHLCANIVSVSQPLYPLIFLGFPGGEDKRDKQRCIQAMMTPMSTLSPWIAIPVTEIQTHGPENHMLNVMTPIGDDC
jgi:hypothetical protein